jgi:hypothetical protein
MPSITYVAGEFRIIGAIPSAIKKPPSTALISVIPLPPFGLNPVKPSTERGRIKDITPVAIVPRAAIIFKTCEMVIAYSPSN